MTLTEKSGHLAWCALTALALARQDGVVCSDAQENLFLTRWLATALKQHRFPRDVAPDIQWLLRQGRQYGPGAKLPGKLDYLWRSCTGSLSEQSDLFRLTYALETAKDMGWTYRLLADREWTGRHAVTLNPMVNSICLSRSSLDAAFDSDGWQVACLKARLSGVVTGLTQMFINCGWQMAPHSGEGLSDAWCLSAKKAAESEENESTTLKATAETGRSAVSG